jgi:hypothetical protein
MADSLKLTVQGVHLTMNLTSARSRRYALASYPQCSTHHEEDEQR